MEQTLRKLKLVFIPFVLLAIAITGGYTFLNWLLLIRLKLFSVDEDVVNIWIPLLLPWLPVLLWLRPRIKLLQLKTKRKSDLPGLYIFVAGFALAVPTLVAQAYIETASGELTKLAHVGQISNKETKYYALEHYYLDKANTAAQSAFKVTGRYNEDFNMHLYLAVPILEKEEDTAGHLCVAWYGKEYTQRISNHLEPKEKEEKYDQFATESEADFNKAELGKFVYLDRIGASDDHKAYNEAICKSEHYVNCSEIVLLPVNEPFEARNGGKFGWIFKSFIVGAFLWLVMVLIPKLDEDAIENRRTGVAEKEGDGGLLALLKPGKAYFITPIIIDLNVLLFIIMALSGMGIMSFKASDLLNWGANYRPSTMSGEWWRLLTSTFLHGGIMHLLCNMYGLVFVGIFLEPVLGRKRYAVAYLVSGVLASIASLWWHDATVSVGASGAIFGMYGMFLALLLLKVFPRDFSKAFLLSTVVFVGYNLLMGLAGGIDNAAHIGGLLSGFVMGLLLSSRVRQQVEENTRKAEELEAAEAVNEDKVNEAV